mmetsp:Transcript_57988/g.66796  ORF Transcript_57988/g.66796 Transcript_57988/m.66796 type:complete len:249 (-) Transcript_57988:712-1458(-)
MNELCLQQDFKTVFVLFVWVTERLDQNIRNAGDLRIFDRRTDFLKCEVSSIFHISISIRDSTSKLRNNLWQATGKLLWSTEGHVAENRDIRHFSSPSFIINTFKKQRQDLFHTIRAQRSHQHLRASKTLMSDFFMLASEVFHQDVQDLNKVRLNDLLQVFSKSFDEDQHSEQSALRGFLEVKVFHQEIDNFHLLQVLDSKSVNKTGKQVSRTSHIIHIIFFLQSGKQIFSQFEWIVEEVNQIRKAFSQ